MWTLSGSARPKRAREQEARGDGLATGGDVSNVREGLAQEKLTTRVIAQKMRDAEDAEPDAIDADRLDMCAHFQPLPHTDRPFLCALGLCSSWTSRVVRRGSLLDACTLVGLAPHGLGRMQRAAMRVSEAIRAEDRLNYARKRQVAWVWLVGPLPSSDGPVDV